MKYEMNENNKILYLLNYHVESESSQTTALKQYLQINL